MLSLHVTEASAQAGEIDGWLHFVSRNDLRGALAWHSGVSSAHSFH